jgi:hypothetical protein
MQVSSSSTNQPSRQWQEHSRRVQELDRLAQQASDMERTASVDLATARLARFIDARTDRMQQEMPLNNAPRKPNEIRLQEQRLQDLYTPREKYTLLSVAA